MALGDGHGVLRVRMWPVATGPWFAWTYSRALARSAHRCPSVRAATANPAAVAASAPGGTCSATPWPPPPVPWPTTWTQFCPDLHRLTLHDGRAGLTPAWPSLLPESVFCAHDHRGPGEVLR